MAAKSISPEEVKRLKGLGFLNNKNTAPLQNRISILIFNRNQTKQNMFFIECLYKGSVISEA